MGSGVLQFRVCTVGFGVYTNPNPEILRFVPWSLNTGPKMRTPHVPLIYPRAHTSEPFKGGKGPY